MKLTANRSTITHRSRLMTYWIMAGQRRAPRPSAGAPCPLRLSSGQACRPYFSDEYERSQDELNLLRTGFTSFDAKLIWLSHSHGMRYAPSVTILLTLAYPSARFCGSVSDTSW